jgi:hypothetical protein
VYQAQGDNNSASAALEAVIENYRGGNPDILSTARGKYEKLNGPATPKPDGSKGVGNLLELEEGGN